MSAAKPRPFKSELTKETDLNYPLNTSLVPNWVPDASRFSEGWLPDEVRSERLRMH